MEGLIQGTADQGNRVLAIVPCFNEAKNIARVIQEIRNASPDYDVLVIDDGSTDDSFNVAVSAGASCVRLVANLGIGGAVHTGIKFAWREGYPYCVQIDGDGQHRADQIRILLEALGNEGAPWNIVVGSRYLDPDGFRSTLMRRFGSRMISFLLRVLFRREISDPTSGMRLFDRRAIRFFAAYYPHDFPEPISLAQAMRSGLRVTEASVRMRPREHGVSSIGKLKSISYMARVSCYILLTFLSRRTFSVRNGGSDE